MGMLMTTAYILAMDTFGPITDNAGGIAEFSRAEASAREITDRLDAVGNTTKALTKGYAIASASLAAFLLFSAYIDKVNLILGRQIAAGKEGVTLMTSVEPGQRERVHRGASSPRCSSTSSARWPSGPWARRPRRSSSRCAASSGRCPGSWTTARARTTRASWTSPPGPPSARWSPRACVAVATPIVVGVLLGYEAVAGLLMVGTIAGVLLATVLNNGGGAWDNAKKYIESGPAQGRRRERPRQEDATPTRRRSSATPSAIRSRTPPARRSTSS